MTTMTQYDATAEDYEREVTPQYARIADLVVDRVFRGPAPTSVVELAAGTGNLTRRLAPHLPDGPYVALDISGPMLEVAAKSVDSRVTTLVADLEAVPMPTGVTDLVVSCLGPVQDSGAGLAEVMRLLRPGGRLVVGMWGFDYSELRLLRAVRHGLSLEPAPTRDLGSTMERLERAGLVSIDHEEYRLPVVHASIAHYMRYRAAFGGQPDLTPAQQRAYDAALESETARYAGADGAVALDWSIVVLEARRPEAL